MVLNANIMVWPLNLLRIATTTRQNGRYWEKGLKYSIQFWSLPSRVTSLNHQYFPWVDYNRDISQFNKYFAMCSIRVMWNLLVIKSYKQQRNHHHRVMTNKWSTIPSKIISTLTKIVSIPITYHRWLYPVIGVYKSWWDGKPLGTMKGAGQWLLYWIKPFLISSSLIWFSITSLFI